MKDFFNELVLTRQSCRDFNDKPLSVELVLKIAEQARFAPSACNSQPWKMYVVADSEKLNGVFEAAQAAADQYLESIMAPLSDTQERCSQMLAETEQQCQELLRATHESAHQVWEVIRREIYNPKLDHAQWQQIAEYIDKQLKRNYTQVNPK